MRICSGAGCLRAVPDDVRFCDECREDRGGTEDGLKSHANGYTEDLDRLRKSARWQQIRSLVVKSQPFCQRCGKQVTQIVDHIIPAEIAVQQARDSGKYLDRWAGYFLRSNLQGLCRECHWVKTNEDKAHTGPWPNVIERDELAPKKVYSF